MHADRSVTDSDVNSGRGHQGSTHSVAVLGCTAGEAGSADTGSRSGRQGWSLGRSATSWSPGDTARPGQQRLLQMFSLNGHRRPPVTRARTSPGGREPHGRQSPGPCLGPALASPHPWWPHRMQFSTRNPRVPVPALQTPPGTPAPPLLCWGQACVPRVSCAGSLVPSVVKLRWRDLEEVGSRESGKVIGGGPGRDRGVLSGPQWVLGRGAVVTEAWPHP